MLAVILKMAILFHTSATALGTGSSTLAITSFLRAITDGVIEPAERAMLGMIYVSLRVSMVSILLLTLLIHVLDPSVFGSSFYYLGVLIAILFFNAFLMTLHLIPSTLGPALQAGTWYTLGFVVSINMFALFTINFYTFSLLYLADVALALVLVNGAMYVIKVRQRQEHIKKAP